MSTHIYMPSDDFHSDSLWYGDEKQFVHTINKPPY